MFHFVDLLCQSRYLRLQVGYVVARHLTASQYPDRAIKRTWSTVHPPQPVLRREMSSIEPGHFHNASTSAASCHTASHQNAISGVDRELKQPW